MIIQNNRLYAMKNLFVLMLACFLSSFAYSQNCTYSFNGNLSDSNKESLMNELSKIPLVENCSVIFKSEQQHGQLRFTLIKTKERNENESPFSPVDVKAILLKYALEPVDFTLN